MDNNLSVIQEQIDDYRKHNDNASVGELNDGYHSFNALYDHRMVLSAFMFNKVKFAFKSRKHFDNDTDPMYDGMFIVGAITPFGQISYHYDNKYWNLFKVPAIERAPEWDGHTPQDVVERMMKIIEIENRNDHDAYYKARSLAEKYLVPCMGSYKDFVLTFLTSRHPE